MKKIAIIGLGYVGLPTAIILAEEGLEVLGFDIDSQRVAGINQGIAVIEELELGERLQAVLKYKKFRATTVLEKADYFVIAVPTPIDKNKQSDLSCVWSAIKNLVKYIRRGSCVIIESTVPIGTTRKVADYLSAKTRMTAGQDFFVAFSPERVMPTRVFADLVGNDRSVGGIGNESSECAKWLYKKFVKGAICLTTAESAEMVKLVENSKRDVDLAYANQVYAMAKQAGLNPYEIIELANRHQYISILKPTCGVGGHCIAVDPWFLIEKFPQQTELLQAARKINDGKPKAVLLEIKNKIKALKIKDKTKVVVLGVTYKPDVDDLRNSPAMQITKELSSWKNINLTVIDPYAVDGELKKCFTKVGRRVDENILSADLVVLLVGHTVFLQKLKNSFVVKNLLNFSGANLETSFFESNLPLAVQNQNQNKASAL